MSVCKKRRSTFFCEKHNTLLSQDKTKGTKKRGRKRTRPDILWSTIKRGQKNFYDVCREEICEDIADILYDGIQ